VVTKDADGKVHVEKHEKPTQHGAWGGIAVGAAVGILAAPAVLPAAAVMLKLDSPLALASGRTPPVLPEKHLEQIADPSLLCLLRQGMTQR
jgi:hypothetical protein